MTASPRCLDAIKRFEGFSPEPYRCPAGKLTIGYGSTRYVMPGVTVTEAMATDFLRADLSRIAEQIESLVTVPLTQGQLDALCSFVYNVGIGAFTKSTLLRKLNAGDPSAADEFLRWTHANGKELPGLVARRNAEREMFTEVSNA